MSRPIVVTACMSGSSESWGPQQHPHPWHCCAGGGAVHSIISGQFTELLSCPAAINRDCSTGDIVRRGVGEPQDERSDFLWPRRSPAWLLFGEQAGNRTVTVTADLGCSRRNLRFDDRRLGPARADAVDGDPALIARANGRIFERSDPRQSDKAELR